MRSVPSEVLKELTRAFPISNDGLIKIGGGDESSDGVVYQCSDRQQQPVLLKVRFFEGDELPQALRDFEAKLDLVHFLNQRDLPIVRMLPSSNGKKYHTLENDSGLWLGYLMEKAPGRQPPPKVWDPTLFRAWGAALGKWHRAVREYPDWDACREPTGESFLTWQGEWKFFYGLCSEGLVKIRWEGLYKILAALPVSQDTFGFTHNDPHLFNIRWGAGKITLLDFDVANHHWFANDLAIACQHVLLFLSGGLTRPLQYPERLHDFLTDLLEGYRQENPFDGAWLPWMNTFFDYRRILLYLVSGEWRESDPSLQKSWLAMIKNPPILVS